MDRATDYKEVLREEYCPPLDEALFLAIVSDYDLALPEERHSVIQILSPLKKSAFEEEHAEFDPTGTGGFREVSEDLSSAPPRSMPEDDSTSNGVTSITTGLSGLELEAAPNIGNDLESLSEEDKLNWLHETFPNIVPFEATNMLKKCNGNLNHTVDNLLNLSFLPKGIDGFDQDEHFTPLRKGRGKRRLRTTDSSRASSEASQYTESPGETANNIWASIADNVEFICARTTLDGKTVKSVWHANGTSLPATIRALALKHVTALPSFADAEATIQIRVVDLKQDFPGVPEAQLHSILDLARNIPSAAHDLVEVMVTVTHADTIPSGKVLDFAHYAPIRLESDTDRPSTPTKWTTMPPSTFASPSYVANHSLAASNAFQQAGSAYKRGKSDRLMGGVASYYAQVGHEHVKMAKQQSAADSNAHVATQSSSTHVDLHGVSVFDAVRIARDRTEYWWEGLGDTKYYSGGNNAARTGFRIITGVGKHSKDGALRIGPAVSKMLMREGWRAEVLAGEIIIRGKAKH